ncbi:MAG: hypothetical protein J6Q05_04845 [Elusimicrobiaceae bacterium]|nr:hypothetical protein [Elusimicrobiaceae bacterium]
MLKQILTFSCVLLLCACATVRVKQVPAEVRALQKVDFFAEGKTQVAFKVTGSMDGMMTDGVVTAKKIGEEDVEIVLLTGGLYKVMHAIVSPEGVAYRYLFKDVDNGVVRGRITQLLDLLFSAPGTYAGSRTKNGQTRVTYQGPRAKEIFIYEGGATYPVAARTVTALNGADLVYGDYMPISADGTVSVPHELVYKDGKIVLELNLISLR